MKDALLHMECALCIHQMLAARCLEVYLPVLMIFIWKAFGLRLLNYMRLAFLMKLYSVCFWTTAAFLNRIWVISERSWRH
ncbi:hypothetical protein D3C73_1290340 [compost metagenome]